MRYTLILALLCVIACNTNKDGVNYQDETIPPAYSANTPITSGFTLVGTYKAVSLEKGEKPCPLELKITEIKNTLWYHFSGHDIDEKGEAIVHVDTINPPISISFSGLNVESEADNPREPKTVTAGLK